MSVELMPNNPRCSQMGLANGVWFAILRESEIGDLIGRRYTNDPLRVSKKTALCCAAILARWQPPDDWYHGYCRESDSLKADLVEFFKCCNGFATS